MSQFKQNPSNLARLKYVIIYAHFSDNSLDLYTNQIIRTGSTPKADHLAMLRQLEIDKLAARIGNQGLVVSLEMGIPGDPIKAPKE